MDRPPRIALNVANRPFFGKDLFFLGSRLISSIADNRRSDRVKAFQVSREIGFKFLHATEHQ